MGRVSGHEWSAVPRRWRDDVGTIAFVLAFSAITVWILLHDGEGLTGLSELIKRFSWVWAPPALALYGWKLLYVARAPAYVSDAGLGAPSGLLGRRQSVAWHDISDLSILKGRGGETLAVNDGASTELLVDLKRVRDPDGLIEEVQARIETI